jgi:hypothetical protein
MFNFIKKKMIETRDQDDMLFEYVMEEMEDNVIIKSSWAKAIAYSEGDENKAKSLYMQYRVQAIKDMLTKFNIAYNEIERESLFNKIKSLFSKPEVSNVKEPKVSILDTDDDDYTDIEKTYTKLDVFFYPNSYTEEEKKEILGDEY